MFTFKLNDGNELPAIGSGTNTFGKENSSYMGEINFDTTPIETAIEVGYRRFDTAISYRNEAVLALGIKNSNIARNELFITSKLPNTEEFASNREAVVKGIELSLKNLDTDYIDLYLIHHPSDDNATNLMIWEVFEEYHHNGVLKSIGVSNFNQKQLQYLMDHSKTVPAVNQIESNPNSLNDELIDFCQQHGIVPEAWGPFHGVTEQQQETLATIGKAHGKTWAQVFLRYQLDRGVAVIPKSHNQRRQASNLDVFDFTLSDEEKNTIKGLA
ncbi:MAG: aldo/keto reductase [Erysipelothrix sp.]|nr:aldo/keto reductase [Erysipelothrix sp.]